MEKASFSRQVETCVILIGYFDLLTPQGSMQLAMLVILILLVILCIFMKAVIMYSLVPKDICKCLILVNFLYFLAFTDISCLSIF